MKSSTTSGVLYEQLINETVQWDYNLSENNYNQSVTAGSTITLVSDDEDTHNGWNGLTELYSITDDIYEHDSAQQNLLNEHDELELSTQGYPVSSYEVTKVVLHRGRISEELLEIFQQKREFPKLQIEMVLPIGEVEQAHDVGGGFRD